QHEYQGSEADHGRQHYRSNSLATARARHGRCRLKTWCGGAASPLAAIEVSRRWPPGTNSGPLAAAAGVPAGPESGWVRLVWRDWLTCRVDGWAAAATCCLLLSRQEQGGGLDGVADR